RALGKLGDKAAIEGLIPVLKDPVLKIREEAAIALGELMDSSATKPLLSAFKKEKKLSVRKAIIHAIGKTEGHAQSSLSFLPMSLAIRPLIKGLSDKELEIRSEAAESLAKIYLNLKKFSKAKSYFNRASEEALSWEFKRPFYIASGIGCGIIDLLNKKLYRDYEEDFKVIYENLESAAKMLGNQAFISKNYWKILEVYNDIFQSNNKAQFIQSFRDLGLKILILAKKLPEGKEDILNDPQDRLNEKFQMIDKRNLSLSQSLDAIEALKEDLFEIGNQILQIEPLEIQLGEDKEATINVIEELTEIPSMMQFAQKKSTSLLLREEEILIRRHATPSDSRNFSLEEVTFDASTTLFAGQELTFGLVQYMKGSSRKSLIESERDMWERHVKRYYNYEIYRENRVLQFTKESIQMRAKPKIIGYLDDSIYDGHKLIIFPECSIPESYLPKLQEFANRFNIFIIAGVETITQKGLYHNRAYIVSP
ncbi:MAG: HEAT repeat domain-containing protein, partial [Candidatus Heimdallarchaeota archaeon]|nr:HEAT repeat domain-containing protein [Candidatus Heimdallarchaeota archaeon]